MVTSGEMIGPPSRSRPGQSSVHRQSIGVTPEPSSSLVWHFVGGKHGSLRPFPKGRWHSMACPEHGAGFRTVGVRKRGVNRRPGVPTPGAAWVQPVDVQNEGSCVAPFSQSVQRPLEFPLDWCRADCVGHPHPDQPGDAIFIFIVLTANAAFGYWQEGKAEEGRGAPQIQRCEPMCGDTRGSGHRNPC